MNRIEKFDLQRRVVSYMVSSSWKNVPHVSYVYEPDITDFYEVFEALAKEKGEQGKKFSFNTIMLYSIVEGLKVAPKMNATIAYNKRKVDGTLTIHEEINVSIPWLFSDGRMMTPVLDDAQSKTLDEFSEAIAELGKKVGNTNLDEMFHGAVTDFKVDGSWMKKAIVGILRKVVAKKLRREGFTRLSGQEKEAYDNIPESDRLKVGNLLGGTVTVSNIGSLYKEQGGFFTLLEIIPPQVVAIGIGAVQEKPGVYVNAKGEKVIGIRKRVPLCLAFDHRAIDFNEVVPFLKAMDNIFSNPEIVKKW